LTADADNLSDYYVDGKEVVIFKSMNEMMEKAKYYLEHQEERDKIAKAGYERTIKEHTYEQRFKEIFSKLF
jgi:spore maturation protein CgeB